MDFELADGLAVMLERAKTELVDMESAIFDDQPEPNPQRRWPTLALLSAHYGTNPSTDALEGKESLRSAPRGVRNEKSANRDL